MLKPCMLVASPALSCPFFNHSVVLLVDHREDGSLGFVVNRDSGMSFEEVLEQVGLPSGRRHQTSVMQGGPVSPETGWLIFDPTDGLADGEREGIIRVNRHIGVSANMDILERIASGAGPRRRTMMLGYAGWGPGQLDDEIREGSWITTDLDPSLIFDVPIEERWRRAWSAIGVDPAQMSVGSSVAEA
ncbi:MAG: YqgE/AlgH family protein [Polyangiales bacterium]